MKHDQYSVLVSLAKLILDGTNVQLLFKELAIDQGLMKPDDEVEEQLLLSLVEHPELEELEEI